MVFAHMGVRKNWWASLALSPVLMADVENRMPIGECPPDVELAADIPPLAEDDDDVDGPEEAGSSAAKARKVVQERRDDSEGTLHYIARLLMKHQNMDLWTGMTSLSKPFRRTFYHMEQSFSTKWGTRELMEDIVMNNLLCSTISDAFDKFFSVDFAYEMGLTEQSKPMTDETGHKLLGSLWRLNLATCGSLAAMHGHYQQIPAQFIGLLSEHPA